MRVNSELGANPFGKQCPFTAREKLFPSLQGSANGLLLASKYLGSITEDDMRID